MVLGEVVAEKPGVIGRLQQLQALFVETNTPSMSRNALPAAVPGWMDNSHLPSPRGCLLAHSRKSPLTIPAARLAPLYSHSADRFDRSERTAVHRWAAA